MQSKMLIYLWLGLHDKSEKASKGQEFLSGLPGGFEVPPPEISRLPSPMLPIKITYEGMPDCDKPIRFNGFYSNLFL